MAATSVEVAEIYADSIIAAAFILGISYVVARWFE